MHVVKGPNSRQVALELLKLNLSAMESAPIVILLNGSCTADGSYIITDMNLGNFTGISQVWAYGVTNLGNLVNPPSCVSFTSRVIE